MANETAKDIHPFSADRPISIKQEDLLGRAGFVDALAQAISGWQGNESLVIALSGPWGSGKTSIKNLLLERIATLPDCPLQPVDFNPWQWSAQDQLIQAFFGEVGIVLHRTEKTKADKKRALKWKAYALKLKAGGFIADGIRKLVTLVFGILAILGLASSVLDSTWFRTGGLIVGIISVAVIALMNWFGEAADRVAAYLEARANFLAKTLPELKKELRDELARTNRPILVIIDDIDRLLPAQTKLLFQLVKANADFPNIIYLLLFQRDIVEKNLSEPGAMQGNEFLEKIVQVWFDLPLVERQKLEKVLFAGLDRLLATTDVSKRFDQNRWANIFVQGMRPYFKTMRDVHRYLSTLSFYAGIFKNKGIFEVNPIDLMALEALRLFEPLVYSQIPNLHLYLTGQDRHGTFGDEHNTDQTKKLIESLISQASAERKNAVRQLIKQLFPPIEWVLGGSTYGSDFAEKWYRELRVCHPNVFDRYFQLSIPEGELSQADVDAIITSSSSRENLVKQLKQLNERHLLGVALNRLEAYKEEIDLANAIPFTTAIFDIGDELPDNPIGFVSIGYDMHAVRLIYWNLKRDVDHQRRLKVLKQAMEQTDGIYLPVMYTSLEEDKQEKQRDSDVFQVEGEDLSHLRSLCSQRIATAAENGRLNGHPKMAYLMHRWMDWGNQDEVKAWVQNLLKSPDGLLSFLNAFVNRSTSQGVDDYVPKIHYQIHLKSIERFVDVTEVENKVKGVEVENLPPEHQRAVQAFLKAVKRRAEGKSDDDWRDDD